MLSAMTTGVGSLGLMIGGLGVLLLMRLSRLPLKAYRSVTFVILGIALIYGVALGWVWPGWRVWDGHWSSTGLEQVGVIITRITLVFFLTRIFAAVTAPLEQGLGIASLLGPLTRFNRKVADFALLITLTLRFIPLLAEEAECLWKARIVRGPLPSGWFRRSMDIAGLFVPLLLLTLRRAEEVAENVLARGYTPGQYRVVNLHEWSRRDSLALLIAVIWGGVMLIADGLI